jgi:hypothetical protein
MKKSDKDQKLKFLTWAVGFEDHDEEDHDEKFLETSLLL